MLKNLHEDVLWIMLIDLAKRCDAREISMTDYARESNVLHDEIHRRYNALNDTIRQSIDRVGKKNGEYEILFKQIYDDHNLYVDQSDKQFERYESFISSKGLEDECDDYFDQLLQDEAVQDNTEGVCKACDTPLYRFVVFLYGIVPKKAAERIYGRLSAFDDELLKQFDDEIFNELIADGKI